MTARGLPLNDETRSDVGQADSDQIPEWFNGFLLDRQTRKPSAHTMKAYRQDFTAIASLITAGQPASMNVTDIDKDSMRAAFAAYAQRHEAASIRRCWSTWDVLCTFLYTGVRRVVHTLNFEGVQMPSIQAVVDQVIRWARSG